MSDEKTSVPLNTHQLQQGLCSLPLAMLQAYRQIRQHSSLHSHSGQLWRMYLYTAGENRSSTYHSSTCPRHINLQSRIMRKINVATILYCSIYILIAQNILFQFLLFMRQRRHYRQSIGKQNILVCGVGLCGEPNFMLHLVIGKIHMSYI